MDRSAEEILREKGITLPRGYQMGRHYTTCPFCGPTRKNKAHARLKCLGVTIDQTGVKYGCNHCEETGGGYYEKSNKRDGNRMVRSAPDQRRDSRGYGDLHREVRKKW